ncbi:hypothetical protein GCM10009830_22560 [Glycomyces endophyticus]|uniref:Antitoxin n=1 Tax=Glycomyces endophyticus TaxID=480996 RepID=A0ABN2GR00_9ACTN
MSDLMLHDIPEDELELIKAEADAQQKTVQDYLLERVHELAIGAKRRRKLDEITAQLKTMPPSTYTVEDVLDAKDAPRRGLA